MVWSSKSTDHVGVEMIDIRDISYTEGDPMSPHAGGELLQTAPPPTVADIPTGGTVATKWDVPGQPPARTVAEREASKVKPIDPLSMVGIGAPGGLSPFGVVTLWQSWWGSAETQQKISMGLLGGAMSYIEPLGLVPPGTTQDILDIPVVDFPGSAVPGLPALDTALPGAGDVIGGVTNIFTGGSGGGLLGGIGSALKGALPWFLLIGAGYLLLRRK